MMVNKSFLIEKLLYEVTTYLLGTSRDSSVPFQYLVI